MWLIRWDKSIVEIPTELNTWFNTCPYACDEIWKFPRLFCGGFGTWHLVDDDRSNQLASLVIVESLLQTTHIDLIMIVITMVIALLMNLQRLRATSLPPLITLAHLGYVSCRVNLLRSRCESPWYLMRRVTQYRKGASSTGYRCSLGFAPHLDWYPRTSLIWCRSPHRPVCMCFDQIIPKVRL